MEIQRQQADEVQQPDDSKAARIDSVAKPAPFRTFEEAVDASGLLTERPPVQPGDSGTNAYLVQPTQLLSWYPRHDTETYFRQCASSTSVALRQSAWSSEEGTAAPYQAVACC